MVQDIVSFQPTQSSLAAGKEREGDRKGSLEGIMERSGAIDCGFLDRGSRTEKYKLLTYFLLQGVCAKSFLLSVSFHFRKKISATIASICLCPAVLGEGFVSSVKFPSQIVPRPYSLMCYLLIRWGSGEGRRLGREMDCSGFAGSIGAVL